MMYCMKNKILREKIIVDVKFGSVCLILIFEEVN